jgi:hypothetical protein
MLMYLSLNFFSLLVDDDATVVVVVAFVDLVELNDVIVHVLLWVVVVEEEYLHCMDHSVMERQQIFLLLLLNEKAIKGV